jgi:hypothetical protein
LLKNTSTGFFVAVFGSGPCKRSYRERSKTSREHREAAIIPALADRGSVQQPAKLPFLVYSFSRSSCNYILQNTSKRDKHNNYVCALRTVQKFNFHKKR